MDSKDVGVAEMVKNFYSHKFFKEIEEPRAFEQEETRGKNVNRGVSYRSWIVLETVKRK